MMKKPRILCIGMPVRDLTFHVQGLPKRGLKIGAERFEEMPAAMHSMRPSPFPGSAAVRRSAVPWAMLTKLPAATSSTRWRS